MTIMNGDIFSQKFEQAQQRLQQLRSQTHRQTVGQTCSQSPGQLSCNIPDLLAEAVEELSKALEELRVLAAERQRQHEQLQVMTQTLANERQQYRELFELAPDGYLVTNAEGILQQANRTAADLLNRQRSFLVGKPLAALMAPSERVQFYALLTRLQQGELIQRAELSLQPHHRQSLPVSFTVTTVRDYRDQIVGFRWLFRDLTQQRQAETALRQSEEQLRLVTDALPVLISYVDTDQYYRFTNRAYEDWFGKPRAALQGLPVWQVIGEPAYAAVKGAIATALQGETVTWEQELELPGVGRRWLSGAYVPHIDPDGGVKGFFALVSDICDRKAIERQKDDFIAIVSHELRTPLASLHGALKLLANGHLDPLSDEGQRLLAIADESTDRLVRLVNDVLDMQRLQSAQLVLIPQISDGAELVIRAINRMQIMAQEHQVALSAHPNSLGVWADSDYIVQVLTNLISNALKFSSPGGRVSISVEPVGADVRFGVHDQGQGIAATDLGIIFDAFQQVDASDSRLRGGSGLGLTICRGIIEHHGGKIWAESRPGQGSTFYFTLPGADLAAASHGLEFIRGDLNGEAR
jgi:PAS domain S-box-containing protein